MGVSVQHLAEVELKHEAVIIPNLKMVEKIALEIYTESVMKKHAQLNPCVLILKVGVMGTPPIATIIVQRYVTATLDTLVKVMNIGDGARMVGQRTDILGHLERVGTIQKK